MKFKTYTDKSQAYRVLKRHDLREHAHFFEFDYDGNYIPVLVATGPERERIEALGFKTADALPTDFKVTKSGNFSENRLLKLRHQERT